MTPPGPPLPIDPILPDLARALAARAGCLLLDEPLSAMDLQTSKHMRMELKRIHQELGVTMLHITHNQMEAEDDADPTTAIGGGSIVIHKK